MFVDDHRSYTIILYNPGKDWLGWNLLMSLSAVYGHCYILVTSKSLGMEKSCICMSIIYTLQTQVYSIHGGYPKKLLNRLVPFVTHLVIPMVMVSDLQTDEVALKSKNVWLVIFMAPHHVSYPWTRTSIKIILQLHQVAVYSYKYENHAELWATRSTASALHSFCHSRWRLLRARDC